jgi:hypothetical protein
MSSRICITDSTQKLSTSPDYDYKIRITVRQCAIVSFHHVRNVGLLEEKHVLLATAATYWPRVPSFLNFENFTEQTGKRKF